MSIENIANRYELEAQRDPVAAAADMKFLSEATQQRILNQMERDANDPNHQANMNVEKDRSGNITAIHFTPLYGESGTLGGNDNTTKR